MKINKRLFICFLLVLMLFICVNAASASDTLDTNLTSEDTADLQSIEADEISQDKLTSSGDTFVVDKNGDGQYTNISDAVSAATGGETIFIKNGVYTENKKIDIGSKQLTFKGESQDGVIINSGDNDLFYTTTSGYSSIVISDLTFKDISMTGSRTPIFIGGDGNVTISGCTFDNCASRYGAIRIYTSGSVIVDNCKLLNTKSSTGSYSSAIDFGGTSTTEYTIKNTVIDGSSISSASTASYIFGAIYSEKTAGIVTLDNVTIINCNLEKASGLIAAKGNMNIKRSKFVNNYVYRDLAIAGFIFVNGAKTVTIESSLIENNTKSNYFLTANSASASFDLNYNNIQGNEFNTAFTNPDNGVYTLDANYWGSNTLPDGITANTWIVENSGEYTLNTGEPLAKEVPGLVPEGDDVPEGAIFVSTTGNDTNDGLSEATAVATIAKAVEIAKAKENKTSTIYLLNGEYYTEPIDVTEVNLTFLGQQKGNVIIRGTGKYIFDVYGDHLVSKFENIDFADSYSPSGNMGALRLYADYSDFTINNCNFRNISAKYGAIDLQGDYGTVNVNNCVVEDVRGSTSMSAIVYVNVAETTVNFDNIIISDCRLDEKYATENPATYLRAVIYVASKSATVTLTNSRIVNNYGANYGGVIESKSKLTVSNTVISDNVINTSVNGNNGGEYLIWASDDNADISIDNCVITGNTIVKATKGLLYNQKGSMNVEYCDLSNNNVEKFVGGTGTLTADNNWWGTNDQPDSKVGKWVIMNVVLDDSDLSENQKITLTIDFNHVKTTSGLENLTGGEIPKDSYSIDLSAKNGEIAPTNVVVNKGQTVSKVFTVTELNDEITLSCDGDNVTVTIEAIPPYRGIIYVNATGNDNNEGSIGAPVATVAKAIELANKGSGEIIINEGTYVGNGYQITRNLTVTGVGKVTLDANNEGRLFYMAYGDSADKLEFSNLILTNANGYGAAVYSFAKELILDNVTIVNNQASGYLIKSSGKLTVKDSYIENSTSGNVIDHSASGDILIKNTTFANNVVTDSTSVYGVVYISSGSGNLVVEDSLFINNTARQGVLIGNNNYNIDVKGTAFVDNTNTVSYGGAIRANGNTLTVTDSVFVNNKASRDGGAIYVGYHTTANVDKSVFVNNSVTGYEHHGDAIYNANKLTVNNCVLLTNAKNFIIYNDGEDNVVNAQRNWWGTNDNPKSLVASGTYEDYYDEEQDCGEVDVSNWVKMSANYDPSLVLAGDEVYILASFDNENLPDGIPVTFTSTSGNLNRVAHTKEGVVGITYTIAANDESLIATSSNASVEMPVIWKVVGVVTNDTFFEYFDEDGILKDSVTANELLFKGEFSDVAMYVIIDRPMSIVGEDAVLNNMGIYIASENVSIDNMTLVATTSLGDLIGVAASNVELTNLDITYIVGDEMANAISVKGKDKVSDVYIKNNSIYFESHVSDDEQLTTAINLDNVEDVIVDGNVIVANIPALYVATYDYTYFMMGLCYVNPIRIYESEGVELTNNKIDVTVNDFEDDYPTVQALYIVGSKNIIIGENNFTMRDTLTPNGTAIYLYAVECGFSSAVAFLENNFDIMTTGGKSGLGSAYALQIATSDAIVVGNTIICDSNGPNLGIYSPYGFGPAKDLIITNNFINVSGYAAGTSDYALVSGIEVQTGYATIYNNTIYVQNKGAYGEKYPVAGISAIQYSVKTLTFDIQDNEIYTNGKYTVHMLYAPSKATVTGNYLLSYDLQGDKSVYFKSGSSNLVENNRPTNVVTNDTFFDFFDDEGVLLTPCVFKELIFNGTFSGLVDMITITAPVSIVGNDAMLNDIAIKVTADNVKLTSLAVNANNKEFAKNEGALIYVTASNVEITDVVVNYTAPTSAEAIAVYANAADNFTMTNSEIAYVATNPGDKHNYALEVRDSSNVLIEENVIDATLPAVDVDYNSGATGIDQDLVLAVGIQGGKDINFAGNLVNVNTNGGVGYYPTIDAVMIYGVNNLLVDSNGINHIDTTTSDTARYYNALDIYSSTATVDNNNILVNTTSGIVRTGTAYPIQLTGPFTVVVSNNILTSISRGPNAGIYASNWGGYADLTVTDNIIDVTGYATAGGYSLVAGIESEIDLTNVYNNIIDVANFADYDDTNPVYGVSIASAYYYGNPKVDIRGNNITVDGKYAVYYKSATDSNVTENALFAHELEGDAAALIESGDNNVITLNFPPFYPQILIEADAVWVGSDDTIVITVIGANGSVSLKVNEKEFKNLVLVNGTVSQLVNASDLVVGANNVVVTFNSTTESIRSGSANGTFYVLDGIVTQDNYLLYFNQEDNGKLFDCIPDGAILDFQGSIINPDQAITVQMNVNKPVNIISTTKDAYIDLNTTAGSLLGESPGNSFAVTYGGSGSNITGIYFHNTQLWISNTHNVVLDNISVVVEDQRVGSGVGATSIRDNSSYVILKNSYLYTRNNGGSTTFTMSWATYCTIDNCTVKAEGNVGNLIYLNTFNIVGAPSGVPLNNYNTVSNNRIYGKEGSGISVGLMVEGVGNLIVNNTLYKSSISTSFGGSNPKDNVYVGNVMTEGGSLSAQAYSIVYNNNVTGTLTAGKGSTVYNNTVGKSMTATADAVVYDNTVATSMSVAAGATAHDNTVGTTMTVNKGAIVYNNAIGTTVTISGADAVFYNNTMKELKINSANADVENNTINGAVTVAKAASGTKFVGNTLTGLVTVNSNNNIIKENNITSTAAYAVDLKTATGNNVTDNYLFSSSTKGDDAVKSASETNIVENNRPYRANITITAGTAWIGLNGIVSVSVPNATGTITLTVNGKTYVLDLVDGVATQEIPAEELNLGENAITAAYEGPEFATNTNSAILMVVDGIVTQDNYMFYFNQEDNGKLFDGIPEGATLDFQGSIINPDTNIVVQMNVNKPVNIISTTGDAYVDLNTTAGSLLGESPGNSFAVTYGGSGSNVTGIYFHNTQLWISNTHNVVLDNISVVVEDQRVGSGVGATSIRDNSSYVTLKNSYLYTRNNGGSTTFTMSWATHCTIDNCTVKAEGNVGNLIYLNIFNVAGAPSGVPLNNYNTVSNNRIYGKEGSGISVGLMVEGTNNLIVNNTLYKSSISTSFGGSNPKDNVYIGNVMTEGGSLTAQAYSIVHDNNATGTLSTGKGSVVYDNIVGKSMTVGADAIAHDNIVTTTMSVQANAVVADNIIGRTVTISGAGATLSNNVIGGTVTVNSNNNVITENTIVSTGDYAVDLKTKTGNNVTENELIAASLTGDAAVKGNLDSNVVRFNYPNENALVIIADDILAGETAKINVSMYYSATGTVKVVVDGKKYDLPLNNGEAILEIPDIKAGTHTVKASYAGNEYVSAAENSTEFTVSKIKSDVVITTSPITIMEDVNVTVTIEGVTGEVTVIVDGKMQTLPLTDGVAKFTIEKIAAGEHTITANYIGDKTHDIASNSTTFTVDKVATAIEVTSCEISAGETAEVTVTLSEQLNVDVLVDFNGKKSYVALVNGTAKLTYDGLAFGTYAISVKYSGDDYFAKAQNSSEIKVNALDAGLKANASDIKVGQDEVISIEINENVTGAVNVYFGDKVIPVTLDAGKATVSISDLGNGTYTATVKFAGDAKFPASEVNVTFTVSKEEIPSDTNISMDIPEGTTAPEFTVVLPSDATGNFTVTVDGKDYTAELVNGTATVKVPEQTPGNHTISATYSGDKKYDGITTGDMTIEIPKATVPGGDSALKIDSPEGSDSPTYSINLPNATGNLTVTVDGKDTYTAALVNGSASITVPGLSQGDHNITVSYSGDAKFAGISKNTTYHVPVASLEKPKDITMLYTAKKPYKVLVKLDGKAVGAGEKVTIKFNGKTIIVKTDKNGYATYKIPDVKPKKAKYTITAEYKGVKVSNKVKVNTVIKAKNVKVKKSKKVNKIKVTLKKVNGKYLKSKKVTLKIKGKTLKAKTNKKGVATFKLNKKVLKKLKVGKKYKYKVTYGKDTVSKKLTVKK